MNRLYPFFSLLITISVLLFSRPLCAQDLGDFRIGVRGGLNLSTLRSQSISERSPRIGYHVGAFVEFYYNDFISFQPELLLFSRGGINTFMPPNAPEIIDTDGEANFSLAYFDIPLPVKVTIADLVSLHLGPYLGYLLHAETSLDGDVADAFTTPPDQHDFVRWDAGLVAGLGLDMKNVTIGFRYAQGFTRIAKSDAASLLLGDGKNSSFQGSIAILL